MRSKRCVLRQFIDVERSAEDLDNVNNANIPSLPPQSRIQRVILKLRDTLQTTFNSFGLCWIYPCRPSFELDKFFPSSLLARSCPTVVQEPDASARVLPPPYPFSNMSVYRLVTWMNSGSHRKLEVEVQRLVKDILQADDFDVKHLDSFSVKRSLRELDRDGSGEKIFFPNDWVETSVTIDILTKSRDEGSKPYTIPGFHYQPLIEVICAAFADIQAGAFHLSPFKWVWKDPLDSHQERIFDELYSSDAWLQAQDELQKLPKEPGCSLEHVIAGLMLFSDATHLANFGTAKAWPLYLYFRNLTKYAWSLPESGACHLVGFLPSVSPPDYETVIYINFSCQLPDNVKDILSGLFRISKSGMALLHTHCRRELFHGCWEILLDEDFVHAYRHGIILRCADGVL
jgi:hypothetical protein